MTSRLRWTLAVLIVVLAVVAASAWFHDFDRSRRLPLPSDRAESRRPPSPRPPAAEGPDPASLMPSARNEIDCVDRLLQIGAPEGADLKAEWERCAALGEAGQNRMADDPGLELDVAPAADRAGNGARPRP